MKTKHQINRSNANVWKWLIARFPANNSLTTQHKNVFILPTRFGVGFFICILLLFVLGTNYQNNPILLVSYFMIGVGLWSVHSCFNNMVKQTVTIKEINTAFVGEQNQLVFEINTTSISNPAVKDDVKMSILCAYADKQTLELSRLTNTRFTIKLPATARGRYTLPVIKFRSDYPFGLIKAWTYFVCDDEFWVYPTPKAVPWHLQSSADNNGDSPSTKNTADSKSKVETGNAQFEGIKRFIPGSSMSQVAWKHYAKQPHSELLLKEFIEPNFQPVLLTLDSVNTPALEDKVSALTQACLDLHAQSKPFGLSLSGYGSNTKVVKICSGTEHLTVCLKALSEFAQ